MSPAIAIGTKGHMTVVSVLEWLFRYDLLSVHISPLIVYLTLYHLAQCSNYLCPGTLACVHFPHHCPCPYPGVEDKFELGEGSAICVSKGGYKAGEAARKVELARKGVL